MSPNANQQHSDFLHHNGFLGLVFFVGFCAMIVAGIILIEGMMHFAGGTAKYVFISAGIVFQVAETLCFIAAAALIGKSSQWRAGLFFLGLLLFSFSIAVMTLAQKATIQVGEAKDDALNKQIVALTEQLTSLDSVIKGYRLNAEKQSNSIYANSRQLGQDSLNRATELEEKKLTLKEKLFSLNEQKRQTSSAFFLQLQNITGLEATSTEFYFLVARSILLELCGIVFMAFAAYLRFHKSQTINAQLILNPTNKLPSIEVHKAEKPKPSKPRKKSIPKIKKEEVPESSWAAKYLNALREQQNENSGLNSTGIETEVETDVNYDQWLDHVLESYREGNLKSLKLEDIRNFFQEKLEEKIDNGTAMIIQRMAQKRLSD